MTLREQGIGRELGWKGMIARFALATLLLCSVPFRLSAQDVAYLLGTHGSMGLGGVNGDFTVAEDDLVAKVPGGQVRVNHDYDGTQWTFNRQWSGLGRPAYYQSSYPALGRFLACTTMDGVSTCDTTALSGQEVTSAPAPTPDHMDQARIPNDPMLGRDANGKPLPEAEGPPFIARQSVGFSQSTDKTSYVSSKYPRFLVRRQPVPILPASAGVDAHPQAGKPGKGGLSTTLVQGYRWIDRTGEWIEYDNLGRISSYGDRNDVRVWLQYGAHGQVERVLDDNGRTVFTFIYAPDAQFIVEARDHTPLDGSIRRVKYQYDAQGRLHAVTNPLGYVTTYDYGSGDTALKITRVTDAEGRVTRVDYGITGRVAKIIAPDGGVTEFDYGYDKLKKEFSTTIKSPVTVSGRAIETRRYDADGNMVSRELNGKTMLSTQGGKAVMSFTNERGETTTVRRDNFGETTQLVYPDGATVSVTYDAGSTDIAKIVDEAGVVSRFSYDGHGNLLSRENAVGRAEAQTVEFQVNARGETTLVRRKGGRLPDGTEDVDVEMHFSYDPSGNVREFIDGAGKTWSYEHDAQGNLSSATDPLGHTWSFLYDAAGNCIQITDPLKAISRYTYDKTGQKVTYTDSLGHTYRLEYDLAGRPAKFIDPTGASLSQEYDAGGRLIAAVDSMNQRKQWKYDAMSRLASLIDGEGNATTFDYTDVDGGDRGSSMASRIAFPTMERLLRFNSRQWLVQSTDIVNGEARTSAASHDERGLLISSTNPYGKTQGAQFDGLKRATEGTNELGHVVHMAYDHHDNLISVTDGLGHATRFQYDARGKLVRQTNAMAQVTAYRYDDAGQLQELVRPNGVRLTFEFDPAGRLVTRTSFRADGSLELVDRFRWDEVGRLLGWSSGAASSTSTYDQAGRRLDETVLIGGAVLRRSYTYYSNGQVKTYTGPDGVAVTYTYDRNGVFSGIQIPGEGGVSVTERRWTAPTKVLLPGGVTQEFEYDPLLNVMRLRVKSDSQAILFDQQSAYGKLGEPMTRVTQGERVDYTYDDALRLRKADTSGWGGATEAFELDAAANRLSDSTVKSTWLYDDANRLISRGKVAYQYDEAGNLIQKTDMSLSEPRRTTRYIYDGYNRLTEVRDGTDQVVSRYTYDPFGYRLSKEVTSRGAEDSGALQGVRLFLQAEEGLLAELDASGSVIQSYGWQPGKTYSTSPIFTRVANRYYYYHNDSLGQPRMLTDKSGAVVWLAGHVSAFGAATTASGATVAQPWRLPGQYYDAETSLHYNLHRYYDAETGRYITGDPLGFKGGLNLYAYVDGNPLSSIDPLGLFCISDNMAKVIGAAAGGFVTGGLTGLANGRGDPRAALAGAIAGAVSGAAIQALVNVSSDGSVGEDSAFGGIYTYMGTLIQEKGNVGVALAAGILNAAGTTVEGINGPGGELGSRVATYIGGAIVGNRQLGPGAPVAGVMFGLAGAFTDYAVYKGVSENYRCECGQ